MSAFTDRLYSAWVNTNRTHRTAFGCSGYGAAPHGRRREGYPTGLHRPELASAAAHPARRWPTTAATSRPQTLNATAATSCPGKTAVLSSAASPFLATSEKSSVKSTPY